ncbi:hypothetical protein CDL15_Pgr017374 [Punica granatum]|uniref:DNA repair metallo-beta-lactamase domain-containing protein n=1 Tax=Punica granatum TaxID=22663 RepID=A0A218Y3M8_PUNGR|nr:hypothetical protein CDL15_Pgr017374 [Punica granatum]PKI79411.1 hypothetical protein CRG98_000158 [Punica granatum]
MPIEMPRGLPFSVDTWTQASQRKRHHFLTHAHRDHSVGIANFTNRIYSTRLTQSLVLQHFPRLDGSLFVNIEVGQSIVIDDPDGQHFTVAAFDANHCPGAVMFLFEGEFGNVLHTVIADSPLSACKTYQQSTLAEKEKSPCADLIMFSWTVLNCIWKHPDAPVVYLTCDLLGQEEILDEVSRTFGSKIYVDKVVHPEFFQALSLTYPEVLSGDSSSRFHLFDGFPRFYERAKAKLEEAKVNSQPEPLIIRPSTQWYACEEESSQADVKMRQKFYEEVKDQFGVWHVCYSMHSSKEELEWALQLLAPKWVASTTPNCWAMELDYVRKNCLASKIPTNDPLWKILDIGKGTPLDTEDTCEDVHCSSSQVIAELTQTSVAAEVQHQGKVSMIRKELINSSPPCKRPNLTLFGRARLGTQDSTNSSPLKEVRSPRPNGRPPQTVQVSNKLEDEVSCQERDAKWNCEELEERQEEEADVKEVHTQISGEKERENRKAFPSSPVWLSKSFSDSFRKLYRSRNVPVPQPLPSLVELNASRRTKRSF